MEPSLAETADDILRRWLPALIEGLDECTTEEQRIKILEHCGRDGDTLVKPPGPARKPTGSLMPRAITAPSNTDGDL